MGFTPHRNGKWMHVPKGEDLKYKAFTLSIDKLKYDTSWDWLMPVVEKISNLEEEFDVDFRYGTMVNLGMRSRYVRCNITDWKDREVAGSGGQPTLISCVYQTVVDFIKWYTANTQPPKSHE